MIEIQQANPCKAILWAENIPGKRKLFYFNIHPVEFGFLIKLAMPGLRHARAGHDEKGQSFSCG